MPTVVLIRPGRTDFDDQHRIQGGLEVPLNSSGVQQVDALVDSLRDLPLQVVYTGPAEPARATAQTIGSELGIPVREKDGLRNLNQGLWEGLPVEEIRHKFPKAFKQWQELPETICPPEGEMVADAVERVGKALHKALKKKAAFAVVASEPLATLIGCVVNQCKPEVPRLRGENGKTAQVEVLQSNGKASPRSIGRASSELTTKRTAIGAPSTRDSA